MTIQEVIDALERVKAEFEGQVTKEFLDIVRDVKANGIVENTTRDLCQDMARGTKTKGGYFVVGDVAIKIEKVERLL